MKLWGATLVAVLTLLGICAGAVAGDAPGLLIASEQPSAVALDRDNAGIQVLDGWQSDPLWRIRANAVWMRLSELNDTVLVNDFSPGGVVLLNASEFTFNYEPGCEVALWRQINDTWNVEGRFFRVDGWSGSRAPVDALGSIVQYDPAPPGFGDAFFPATIAGSYQAELNNVEINGRRQINDFWSLLVGFRYLALDDRLSILQDFGPGLLTVTHDVRAVNDLFGFQFGAEMYLWSRGRLSIEGLFKAGVYSDHAVNSVHIGAPQSSITYESNASATQAAFAGELSITSVYRFSKHLSVRGGYQFLWLEGVAQASDQVAVSNPLAGTASLSFKGSPSYDGAFIGLEFAR